MDIQCVPSLRHPPLSPCIPPGLKQSIQNVIRHNVQKYACRLDTSLSHQIEFGLSEAFDFTLNVIEQSFIEIDQASPCLDTLKTAS